MKVVRGELNPDDLYDSRLRYNDATDTVEITEDGGVTYNPAPATSDPRNVMRLPPREGASARCDAAANLVQNLHDYIDANIAALNAGAGVAALISLFFERFPFVWTLLLALIEGLVGVILGLGAADLTQKFTSAVYEDLLCIFYCNMDENGVINEAGMQFILTEIYNTQNVTIYNVIAMLTNATGIGGWNDWAAQGDISGDCAACDPCGWSHTLTPDEFSIWRFDTFYSYYCADRQWAMPEGHTEDAGNGHLRWRCDSEGGVGRLSIAILLELPNGTTLTSVQASWFASGNSDNVTKYLSAVGFGTDCFSNFVHNPMSVTLNNGVGTIYIKCALSTNVVRSDFGVYNMTFSGTGPDPFAQ